MGSSGSLDFESKGLDDLNIDFFDFGAYVT